MKRKTGLILLAVCAAFAAQIAGAVEWRGLDRHVAGPKITAADLEGKVVLVDEWGTHCGPCLALLPRMEQIWNAYRSKAFILLGSERQGSDADAINRVVREKRLTYPICSGAGLAVGEPNNGGGIPFLYVVNPQGKVVYAGRDERAATVAVVDALSSAGPTDSLCGDVEPKFFKALRTSLVFGRPAETAMKRLKAASDGRDEAKAAEAKALLKAIDEARDGWRQQITRALAERPCAAVALVKTFAKTWPNDEKTAAFKAKTAELAALPGFARTEKFVAFVQKLKNFRPRNAGEAKRAASRAKDVAARAKALGEGEGPLPAEARACLDEVQKAISRLEAEAENGRRR